MLNYKLYVSKTYCLCKSSKKRHSVKIFFKNVKNTEIFAKKCTKTIEIIGILLYNKYSKNILDTGGLYDRSS